MHRHHWILLAGALAGYLLLMCTTPVRFALRDGLRAMRRYPQLWTIPALFGFCYALFQLGLHLFWTWMAPGHGRALIWDFGWNFPAPPASLGEAHSLRDWFSVLHEDPRWILLRKSGVEAAENVAGVFNNVITTFPFSAIAALLLFVNYDHHHSTLRQALRKRFGAWHWIVHLAILLCGLAALVKPVLFGPGLPMLNRIAPGLLLVRWSALIDWCSVLFEYLFGVCVQIYLILVAYAWLRGIHFTREHLLDVAIRRFAFVAKWAVVVMLVSALMIDLPRVCALLFRFDDVIFGDRTFTYIDNVARPLLSLFLILFGTMQITLTFHSESLAAAVRAHGTFLRQHGWSFLWFLVVSGLHFFLLAFSDQLLRYGFIENSLPAVLWSLVYPFAAAVLVAWMLAAWVSLFKRCETDRVRAEQWIRF